MVTNSMLGAWVLSALILLLVIVLYRPKKELEEQIKADEKMAAQKGISLEQLWEQRAKRKARKIPQKIKRQVYTRDGFCCQKCGSQKNLTLDHIFPFSKGGSNEPSNLQVLCKRCNFAKANQ